MKKMYHKKNFFIPFSIIMGLLGFVAWFASLLEVNLDDEFNKNYYRNRKKTFFRKRNHY